LLGPTFASALGFGIRLDATIVRSMLVSALVSILGEWSWWFPPWAARLLRVPASRRSIETVQ
jgi:RND superfamily putative drug exporter